MRSARVMRPSLMRLMPNILVMKLARKMMGFPNKDIARGRLETRHHLEHLQNPRSDLLVIDRDSLYRLTADRFKPESRNKVDNVTFQVEEIVCDLKCDSQMSPVSFQPIGQLLVSACKMGMAIAIN